ncbi:hypothetical protein ACNF40_07015 [Cuniculiplasma sp. SKW4]|uniref:hypothetical protein n=1 Tax=Cuniculiplasma sp. SKW4 TaxID=3400171 RepID=UPI003FD5901A
MPKNEVYSFYYYSAMYTILGLILSFAINKIASKGSIATQLPYTLNLILGGLWILDGILQFQPQMPYGFLTFVIEPAITSIPNMQIEQFLYLGYNTWAIHPIQFDALSGALQIFIGFSFLTYRSKRALKLVSAISIFWAIIIWIFGEGFGGIPESGVSILTGFPGSALLYMILALPFLNHNLEKKENFLSFYRISIVIILFVSIILQLVPLNIYWNNGIFSQIIYDNTFNQGESPWIYSIMESIWPLLIYHTEYLNILFSLIVLSVLLLLISKYNYGEMIGMISFFVFWLLFQNMGIYDNPATDFNSGILLVLIISILVLNDKIYEIQFRTFQAVNQK